MAGTANDPLPLSELAARLRSPSSAEALSPVAGTHSVVVRIDSDAAAAALPANCPVIGIGEAASAPDVVDVLAETAADAAEAVDAAAGNPVAAMTLVRLLRHNARVDAADGLFAESLAYSTLQHGAEFERWLATRTRRPAKPDPDAPLVLLAREDDTLRITLNRPHKRNAYSSALRDALCDALGFAVDDGSLGRVLLDGAGACFSAGGDLDEFGEARDAGVAHASRMTRSAGMLIHRLRERCEAHLHGACIGAGIELPAFAGRVIAHRDAFFQLPEVGMGLIPGAGGTASILPRIGRYRLAFMALTGRRIDTATALDWGLVDEVVD